MSNITDLYSALSYIHKEKPKKLQHGSPIDVTCLDEVLSMGFITAQTYVPLATGLKAFMAPKLTYSGAQALEAYQHNRKIHIIVLRYLNRWKVCVWSCVGVLAFIIGVLADLKGILAG